MHNEIKILDIEEKNESFTVVFEVPGEDYNQSYPKRLSHSFPVNDKFFEEVSTGEKRYEKIIRELYLERERPDINKKVEEERKRVKGKTFKPGDRGKQ